MSFTMADSNYVWLTQEKMIGRLDFNFYAPAQLNNDNKIMASDNYLKLGDIVEKKRSEPQTDSADFCEEGIDVVRMGDLSPFEINLTQTVKIPEEVYNKLKEFTLKEGMVIFGLTGVKLGQACIVPKSIRTSITNRRIAQLEIKNKYDPYYIGTYLNTRYGQLQLFRYATGVAQPNLRLEDTEEILIHIPSPEVQKYIGYKVRRAEELREESKLLREEAENIIKVQLLLDKNQSLYNNNAGNPSLEFTKYPINLFVKPKDITERIDSKSYHPEYFETLDFLNNNKFKVMKLYNVIEDYSTGISSPKYTDDGIRILMTKNIKNDAIDLECKLVNRKVETKYRVNYGDVLITTYGGPSIGKVDIFTSKEECVYDYTILKLKFKSDYNPFFMTLLLRSKLIQNQIRNLIKGTTGITFVIPKEILNINIPIFDKDIQDEVGDIYKKSLECIDISKQLIQEAKQDVEDLIEGNFDISKLSETTTESR